jgi:hypothetical protein
MKKSKIMKFTFSIDDTDPKARSIINLLKELNKDYNFIRVSEEVLFDEESSIVKEELLYRQNKTLEVQEGKSLNYLKKEL